jgi:cell division protein FtsQ
MFALSAGVVFLLKAPYFMVEKVTVSGQMEIPKGFVEESARPLFGENIFLMKTQTITEHLKKHPYFSSAEIKRVLPNGISIKVKEHTAKVNYYSNGVYSLLTEQGQLLDVGANPIEGVTLIDTRPLPELGANIYEDAPEKMRILETFVVLHDRNTSVVELPVLDLTESSNIRTYYHDTEIRLGYGDSLKEKLNAAINIILSGHLDEVKGYLDLAYVDDPVIFDAGRITTPSDDGVSGEGEEDQDEEGNEE